MTAVEGILHSVVTVSDMDRSLAFYRDLLGLRVTFDQAIDPVFYARLSGLTDPRVRAAIAVCADGTELEFVEFREPRGRDRVEHAYWDPGHSFLTFRVTDLDAIRSGLDAAGVQVGEIAELPLPGGGRLRSLYIVGPDGESLCLAQTDGGQLG